MALEFEILRHAVHQTHDCSVGRLFGIVPVKVGQGTRGWQGDVHVLELIGHASAKRCYAWAERVSPTLQVLHAVLHDDTIASAEAAVQSRLRERGRKRQ